MEIAPLECVFWDCLESCSNGAKSFASKPLSENQIDVVINSSYKSQTLETIKEDPQLSYKLLCHIHFKK